MKNYRTWLKTAAILQFITAAMHAATLFVTPEPKNETEKQLYNLMSSYQFDFGAGFHRTMDQLTLALSACLCLLCVFAGLTNFYLVKKTDSSIMKGILNINLVVFGALLVLTILFTFILPITQIGLIVLCLLLARFTLPRKSSDR